MNFKTLAVAVAGAALMVTAAQSADLPRSVYKAPAMVAPAFSWTGFYAGANLGYGWGSGHGTLTVTGLGSGPISGKGTGVLGGGQVGYNWQTGPVVFGVETDFQGDGAKGTTTATLPGGTITGRATQPWFGTIRGRLGYAWDRTMVYVTGGGLYGDAKYSGIGPAPVGAFSSSATYWTYVIGGGVESFFIPNWSWKFEYLYAGSPDNAPVPPGTTALTGSSHANIVRAGINYHF